MANSDQICSERFETIAEIVNCHQAAKAHWIVTSKPVSGLRQLTHPHASDARRYGFAEMEFDDYMILVSLRLPCFPD